ncbi:LOW QUALITY PROTEIN: protein teashirt [Drosophila ficusphila]|uniref:LOW QUALITY PROTEIN: protein teashirt n=1 Tax=Drosophila ficusphila TaxID=30025 RepID=UPI001C89CBDD|nr:LOW QUALITY PROTEIN: protein teashirt [Drosophila ficusphila]
MLHEALMLEIYRQALNAGALPTARPRSTESANSSERCPSHDSNSSDNGGGGAGSGGVAGHRMDAAALSAGVLPGVVPTTLHSTFPAVPQSLPAQPPSMEAYLHMVAAAAQQYGFPLAAAAAAGAGPRLPLPLANEAAAPFKLPPQASPTASSNNSEALDFRTNLYGRAESAEPPASEGEEEDFDDGANNPLDLSVGTRKRGHESAPPVGHIQVKKMFKSDSPPANPVAPPSASQLLPGVNPYLAAVAAANIFRAGQFPDWNGKSDLVVDPLEKMSDIVKGGGAGGMGGKEKMHSSKATPPQTAAPPPKSPVQPSQGSQSSESGGGSGGGSGGSGGGGGGGVTKARHNIWQSHWQNKGVASSVFRCVWCKQSFPTLEALTTHMKDSKHCGVNVPPFGNLPSNNPQPQHHHPAPPPPPQNHNLRKHGGSGGGGGSGSNHSPSANVKNAFQYRGDPPTPLPRKLVRGQNVWLGKGVEQAMQILKCMRCGESFRSLGEMTKHMQETQHYTNILSQEQSISIKSASANANSDAKESHNSLSSEESRTLSAVLTCKVCDKAFGSLGDLSNHMAKNNHYAEPLLQSAGARKRPAPKKREKSLPVRKLLEMKGGSGNQEDLPSEKASVQGKPGLGPGGGDKNDAALFAERMRQYITGVKSPEEIAKVAAAQLLAKNKSPELLVEQKNGGAKAPGASSVLSAIEQMFTTSFDTPPRHASLPASSPSNSSTKNTSPVASSILKRLGIDETVDYNKPLIDTNDPYYQHYRYTSSERSGSECSAEARPRLDAPTPEKQPPAEEAAPDAKPAIKQELEAEPIKMEIKSELAEEQSDAAEEPFKMETTLVNGNNNNNNNNNVERSSPKTPSSAASPQTRLLPPRSPAESQRSVTPKSPASSHKSYDGSSEGNKKYPSDSLNALSSMFDSLGSSGGAGAANTRAKLAAAAAAGGSESPENLSSGGNSLAALRQFCVKKEKTA